MSDVALADAPQKVIIPYTPRDHFRRLHNSPKRFKFVCAHRRAGKTVAEFNELLKKAVSNQRTFPPPRYAYVGPSFAQTKDLVWGYAKHYCSAIPGTRFSEGDLEVILPTGAKITLYGGAAAYERMRGVYFDGIVLDEFPLLNPAVFSTVVRPCLADYRGWAIVSGTSNGDDHFHELKLKNENNPDWDIIIIPVTETNALHPDEVIEMTSDMTPEEFAREMLCEFNAPIEGAYYARQMNELETQGRITEVPYDPNALVYTWWDLGVDDAMSVWFVQFIGKGIHVIDHESSSDSSLKEFAEKLRQRGYIYGGHAMPHDIKARELTTGTSRYETAEALFGAGTIFVAPMVPIEDGINSVRMNLPMCWFDREKTKSGRSAMSNYHRSPKTGKPVHNWASHDADSFRTGSVSINYLRRMVGNGSLQSGSNGPLRRRIKGVR